MIILKLLFFAASLLGYCLMFHRRLRIPLEFTPFFTVSFLMTALYVFGYVGSLHYNTFGLPVGFNPLSTPEIPMLYYGTRLLFVLGFASVFYWLFLIRNDFRTELGKLFNPAIVFFSVAVFLLFFPLQSAEMQHTDDLHQWGITVKCLLHYQSFPGTDSHLQYAEYPPGAPLFHYYVTTLTNEREGTYFFSHNLMLLAGSLVFMYGVRWKYFYVLISIPVFVFLCQVLFVYGPFVLMVDTTLAVFFGAILFMYFAGVIDDLPLPRRLIPLIPAIAALTLTKHVGIIFATIFLVIVFADILIEKMIAARKDRRETNVWLNTILLLFLAVTPFLVLESWSIRCAHCNFPQKDLSRSGLLQNLVHGITEDRYPILATFQKAVADQPLNGLDRLDVSANQFFTAKTTLLFLFFLSGILIFSRSFEGFRFRFAVSTFLLFGGALAYLFFMLLVYLFAFDKASGLLLASFQRYAGAYFHAWLFALFGLAVFCFQKGEPKFCFKPFAWLIVFETILYLILLFGVYFFGGKLNWIRWSDFMIYIVFYFRTWFLTVFGLFLFCFRNKTESNFLYKNIPHGIWLVLVLLMLIKFDGTEFMKATYHSFHNARRAAVRQSLLEMEPYRKILSKVKFVCEDGMMGTTAWIVADTYAYEIYPDRFIASEYFGVPYSKRISESASPPLFTPEEWSKSLIDEKAGGVFLYETDDEFWERYSEMFENGQDARNNSCRLYKIVPQNEGNVLLVPVAE